MIFSARARFRYEIPMKINSFYLLVAAVAFIVAGIFWWSLESASPLPSLAAILFGIALVCVARRYIDEAVEDGCTEKINGITALRTSQIAGIGLFLYALWISVEAFSRELNYYYRWVGPAGFRLMGFLCGIILIYGILSLYSGRKSGAARI
jgi:uncharacterized membrane protein